MSKGVITSTGKSHLVNYPTPLSMNYNWSFGSLAGIFLSMQMVTGVFLAIHYTAFMDIAFENLEHIMSNVNNGWLLSYLHANSASFFFMCMYLHIFSGIFYKSYNKPSNLMWNSGVVMLMLSMVVAFMGYVLPWGQMSYWGATVITNLVTAMPMIGNSLVAWIWGGFTVSSATILSFYDFHYLFAMMLAVLVVVHLMLLHEVGSSTPKISTNFHDKIKFYSYFVLKDTFMLISFLMVFLFIVFYYPNMLGHSDNYMKANPLVTPTHMVPEWYFLPFYAILRSIDNKLFGVIAMLLSILILLVLPYCAAYIKNIDFVFGNFIDKFFFMIFSIMIMLLWFIGSLPAEFPYILYGKVLTMGYFSIFFMNYIFLKICTLVMKYAI